MRTKGRFSSIKGSIFTSRLSRRIVIGVFSSLLIVEGIILVPAARKRQREAEAKIVKQSLAVLKMLEIARPGDQPTEAEQLVANLRQFDDFLAPTPLVGITTYDSNGQTTARFGEAIALSAMPHQSVAVISVKKEGHSGLLSNRYEVAIAPNQTNLPYTIVLRYDTTANNRALYAFIGRIIGLVIIISAVVTLTTFWMLHRLIISPLQFVHQQLLAEGTEEVSNSLYLTTQRTHYLDSSDELEDVVEAFNQRTSQLETQIEKTQQALKDLKVAQTQMIQSEKMSSLGQLVAGVAHEINNPASFIHGNLHHVQDYFSTLLTEVKGYQNSNNQALTDDALDKEELTFIEQDWTKIIDSMRSGTKRIQAIVLSLRNFSRLDETGFKAVDIHTGLDSTLLLLNSRFPAEQPTVFHKSYGQIPAVPCFPSALNQVFLQIVSNAVEAVQQKQTQLSKQTENSTYLPRIDISTLSSDTAVTICIRDNGVGMTPETQAKAFDPFFTNKPIGQGTGMGLAVSYQTVVGQHRGQLRCDSTPGEGSQFVIELPLSA